MTVRCFSVDYDFRLSCYLVNARTTYGWYIDATQGAEGNLDIQRDIIKGRKTYETLRADLKRGCVLPPLVLSLKLLDAPESLGSPPTTVYPSDFSSHLEDIEGRVSLAKPEQIQIIDGLQRTNAIRSVAEELDGPDRDAFLARPVRIEIWINIEFFSLAYRMLLLNAGQKPMSMKHQIEVLAGSMKDSLSEIADIELIRGLDKRRRTKPGQFQLSTIAGAFQAWIQKQPNIDLRNAVTEQLLADEAIETLGRGLDPNSHVEGENFREFIAWLKDLDFALGQDHISFLMNETVVHALSAAFASSFAKDETRDRARHAMRRLLAEIEQSGVDEGFGPSLFSDLRKEIDPKKRNVGDATRDLVYRAVSEYIISAGSKSMRDCWTFASVYL